MTAYWLEHALLPVGEEEGVAVADAVAVTVEDGRFSAVEPAALPAGATRLRGLTLPGLANCHSHAFHRALRGRTQRGSGSFWTWRDQMYDLAGRLDPDGYHRLARAAYAEMAAAGFTTVGEFHYLHHQPDGTPYDEKNVMGEALVAAAQEAGLRIALLDSCYLTAAIGRPAEGVQRRFSDVDADRWAVRAADAPPDTDEARRGAAVHSVRAVPREQVPVVAEWARQRDAPLHVHLSEQPAENEASQAAYGLTPTEVLSEAGALSARTSAVHATHLTDRDVDLLGEAGVFACLCPTTERDLGDGVGPASALAAAGARVTLGTDSHACVDPFEEMRALEHAERLASRRRGHWRAGRLVAAATECGHRSLGFPDVGRIEVGARADLVTIDLMSSRTAGCGATAEAAVFAAGSADVISVLRDGVPLDLDPERVGRELDAVVRALWEEA